MLCFGEKSDLAFRCGWISSSGCLNPGSDRKSLSAYL